MIGPVTVGNSWQKIYDAAVSGPFHGVIVCSPEHCHIRIAQAEPTTYGGFALTRTPTNISVTDSMAVWVSAPNGSSVFMLEGLGLGASIGGIDGIAEPETQSAFAYGGRLDSVSHVFAAASAHNLAVTFSASRKTFAWSTIAVGGDAKLEVFLNPTFTGGTAATITNRLIGTTPTVSAVYSPTVSNTGTLLYERLLPAAKGGADTDVAPRIYPAGSTALVRVTALTGSITCGITAELATI